MQSIIIVAYNLVLKKAVQIVVNPASMPVCPEDCILMLWDGRGHQQTNDHNVNINFCAFIEKEVNDYMAARGA